MNRSLVFAALAFCSSAPALADHSIAGGGVSQSGPVVTLDAQTVPAGSLVGGLSVHYTRPDAYTDAELVALASQHIHAHAIDYNATASAFLAYGVTGHFTISTNLPVVTRHNLRAGAHSHSGGMVSNTVEHLGSVSGIGGLSLLGEYVFAHDHKAGWFVSALGGIKIPTGDTRQTAPDGERLETEHQPGTGSWDPLVGLASSKRWGQWALHSSAFYQVSTKGSQATELGDRISLSTAVVHTFSSEGDHHAHSGEAMEHHQHDAPTWGLMLETSYESEGKERVAGVVEDDTGAVGIWLSPGVRFASPKGWSAALSAGVPIWQDIGASHPDNSFRVIMQVGTRL